MTVRLTRDGATATLLFDRPQARNAITFEMYDELARLCGEVSDARVVFVRGAGGAFAAGTDIARLAALKTAEEFTAYERLFERAVDAIETLPMPTVAVAEGDAVGGGAAIFCACDLRYSVPQARFGVPIARTVGNALSVRNTARLVRAVGPMAAKLLLFTGDLLPADAALRAGLLTGIVEPERIEAHVAELAQRLSRNAPLTLRVAKEAIRLAQPPLDEHADLFLRAYLSSDFREGVAAFLEKRKPSFKGS